MEPAASYLQDLVLTKAETAGEAPALVAGGESYSYAALAREIRGVAAGLAGLGLARFERVAVYLDKRVETVAAVFGVSAAGGAFVPCNPVLKPGQVGHILADSGARILITSRSRLEALAPVLAESAVAVAVAIDGAPAESPSGIAVLDWDGLLEAGAGAAPAGPALETDMAALFYTSGSTGKSKGVVLSHRNLVLGAQSVAGYLGQRASDRLLALLPLSFDAGFSQLTTGFYAGAAVVLHNYLFARDVAGLCAREGVTGLTCVPPLWMQLLEVDWPEAARSRLRYFANTGGHMPRATLARLRRLFPEAEPYLMYGLTEAFRSSYLDPREIDRRPDSIGKAVPHAEIRVVKPDGGLAGPGEEGELVHCGPLVSLGYWNDPEATARRFKPAPARPEELPLDEPAVFSGDIVRLDADGFLYFVGRNDDMIKTSGYRVSPAELEEAAFASGAVAEAAAFGIAHETLGQEIVLAVVPAAPAVFDPETVRRHCLESLPRFMVPGRILVREALPRSPNGKIDRAGLAAELDAPSRQKAQA